MKTISEIKDIWEKDNETFKRKELGGLQRFVADIFESKELFNLRQGLESTKTENRNNEFTIEKNKNGRRADIVIFYKGNDVVIPVEVEKYENIEAGVGQLADYQNDWQKAYGILTDGYEWRFYNNTRYKKFTLDEILNNPSQIKTFWEEYVREDNYYLSLFEKTGQASLFKEEAALKVDNNRELFFEDITKLIQKFKDKLGIVGYLQEKGTADSEKKATEISYAYFIQFILYKNLVDNCYGQFNEEFEQRIAKIYKSLKNETYEGIVTQIYGISDFISDKLYKPFNKEQEFINKKLLEVLRKPDVILEEVSLWLDIIVFIKKYNFANLKNEIFGYIYENYLKELFEEQNKGQYFTDPAVVNFMLDAIGYDKDEIERLYKKGQLNQLSIIDPSCGSGTFLYSAVHRIIETLFDGSEDMAKKVEDIINNNIFGLDIAEFPLYLAEMNILMRMLPIIINENYTNPIDKKIKIFKTQDSISEFMDTGITARVNAPIDEKNGQLSLFEPEVLALSYESYIRDEDDLKEMKESMRPPRSRFDFVIGNPPYIGYNECCKQEMLFTELTKQKKISMANVYGVNLNTVPNRVKAYSPKPNLYSFFIALGGGLLKKNGKMCYIIPQTILTTGDLDVLRYYLATETTIQKIITFSGQLFIGRGLKGKKPVATSSLIFVIEKAKPKEDHRVEVINYKKQNETSIENIFGSKGNNKIQKKVLQSKLQEKIDNWNFLTKTQEEIDFVDNYVKNSISIDDYRKTLDDYDTVQFDKGLVFEKSKITEVVSDWNLIKKDKNKIKIGVSGKYIANEFIKLPAGSQGIKIFNNTYKIIWEYMNLSRFYFSDKNIMLDFNWVIISSENKKEILYLLAILNSKLSGFILNNYLKIENEQAILVGIKAIKQYIRMPVITEKNQDIKDEIIRLSQFMIEMEDCKLSDFVDFSTVSMQKFNRVYVENNELILIKEDETYRLTIKDLSKIGAIEETLSKKYDSSKLLNEINLTELKNLNVVDKTQLESIKNNIEELVSSLYFNKN